MTADGITLAGSFLFALGGLVYMAVEHWRARRRRAGIAAKALHEDASVAWLESIPVLEREPEGRS